MDIGLNLKKRFLNFYLRRHDRRQQDTYSGDHAQDVGAFYDRHNDKFLEVYGEVIQAFRTNDLSNILDYQIREIGLKPGMRVLDAGCGVCGPASYFARNADVEIDALTISAEQVRHASELLEKDGCADRVDVRQGDYHKVDELYPEAVFDKVYFLESFGHSAEKEKLLRAVWKVLKPGGEVYIKDLFVRKIRYPLLQRRIYSEIEKINKAYHYQVAELDDFVDMVRRLGYVITFIKTSDMGLEDFENLAISNEWQELTGIAQVKNWDTYVFPVDFFEVKLYKLEYDQGKGKHRYFIQNLFQIREQQTDPENLGF